MTIDKDELRRRVTVTLTQVLSVKRLECAMMRATLALTEGKLDDAAREIVEAETHLAAIDLSRMWIEAARQQGKDLSDKSVYRFGRTERERDPQFLKYRRAWRERVAAMPKSEI